MRPESTPGEEGGGAPHRGSTSDHGPGSQVMGVTSSSDPGSGSESYLRTAVSSGSAALATDSTQSGRLALTSSESFHSEEFCAPFLYRRRRILAAFHAPR